jgi:hypothetical protein
MGKRIQHKQSFPAVDEHGASHTLNVFVEILDARTFGNPHGEVEGIKSIRTQDGMAVNRLDKGSYQIVSTGQILSSDDPGAP